jgi:hypothetical protein
MDGSDSGSCLVAGSGISSVQHWGSATRELQIHFLAATKITKFMTP